MKGGKRGDLGKLTLGLKRHLANNKTLPYQQRRLTADADKAAEVLRQLSNGEPDAISEVLTRANARTQKDEMRGVSSRLAYKSFSGAVHYGSLSVNE